MFVLGLGMVVADDECIIVARSCFQHLLGWKGTVVSSDSFTFVPRTRIWQLF